MENQSTFLMAVFFTLAVCADAQPLTVCVHADAELDRALLERAQAEASRILKTGGVDVMWGSCENSTKLSSECPDSQDSTELVLLLLPARAAQKFSQAEAMGFAMPPRPGLFGSCAGVLYDRVDQLAQKRIKKPILLGHAIAHELGHLLLGAGRHAAGNIMKPQWDHQQMEKAAQGVLGFSVEERRLIQENVRRRLAARL